MTVIEAPLAPLRSAAAPAGAAGAVDDVAPGPSLADLRVAVAGLVAQCVVVAAGAGAGRLPSPQRREALALLDRVADATVAARAAVLEAERRSEAWRGEGDRTFEAWRARVAQGPTRVAAQQVRQAQELAVVPQVAAAVLDGRIGMDRAGVIAKVAATGSPAQRQAIASAEAQEALVTLAQRIDGDAFGGAVARWAATVDPPASEADHQAQRRERFLTMSDTPRGGGGFSRAVSTGWPVTGSGSRSRR